MKIKNTVKVYYYPERNPEIKKGVVLDIAEYNGLSLTKHEGFFQVRYIRKGGAGNLIAFMARVK